VIGGPRSAPSWSRRKKPLRVYGPATWCALRWHRSCALVAALAERRLRGDRVKRRFLEEGAGVMVTDVHASVDICK